jgi:hypothetical protein
LARENIKAVHRITNERLFRHPVSNTFHGRDVFAPVAAHLSKGRNIRTVGPAAQGIVRLAQSKLRCRAGSVSGEIVYMDRFGNAITNIGVEALGTGSGALSEVFVKRRALGQLQPFYQAVPLGKPVALLGSTGFLEIAANGRSAEKQFRLKIGDEVTVRLKSPQKSP